MKTQKTLMAAAVAAAILAPTAIAQQLEEVIVTAQKRAESVQDIPIAVSAFGSEELAAMDAKGFEAIVLRTPGLSGSGDADTQNVLTIRGIGTGAFSPGADNSVGTYFNEIPLSRNIGGMGYLDIERVEVVKGPQGTLFGRNTSSGAISVTNQFAITGDNTLSLRGALGDEGQELYEVTGNWSVTDTFALRLAARHDERDGTYVNDVTGDELNGRDHDQYRIGFTWDATDAFTVNFYYDKFEMRNRWQMVDNFGLWGNDVQGDSIRVNAQPEQKIEADFVVLKLNWDFNDTYSLTSNTGYYQSDIVALPTDADTGDVPIADFIEPWDLEQTTQEFRLNAQHDRVKWFIGASYYYEEAGAVTSLTLYEDPALDVLFEDEGLCLVAEEFGLSCGIHQETSAALNETTSYAVYGDVTIDITDRLQLTVGGRYTDEEKTMKLNTPLVDSTTTALIGVVTGDPNNAVFSWTPGTIEETQSWDSFDPRLALSYAMGDDTLWYANYARGFKSGGFNRQPTTPGSSSILPFDQEKNDAYEIGVKTDFLDQRARLNIAAFLYDYSDYQLETNKDASILIQNVASLDTKGLEIDGTFLIGPSLDVRLAYAYLDAEFKDGSIDDGTGNVVNLKGNRAIRSPENTLSLSGTWRITDQWGLRAEYAYTDEMYFTADNREELRADDFGLLNARVDFNSESGRWGLSLIGDNLTDEEYVTSMIDFLVPMSLPGFGRTVRVEGRYNFF